MSEVSALRKEVDSKRKALNTITSVQGYAFDKGKVYKCKLCEGKFFVSKDYLKAHYKKRHDGNVESYLRKPITLANVKEKEKYEESKVHVKRTSDEFNHLSGRVDELSHLIRTMYEKKHEPKRSRETKTTAVTEETHKAKKEESKKSTIKPEVKEPSLIIKEVPGKESEEEIVDPEATKKEKHLEDSDKKETSEVKDDKPSWIEPLEETKEYKQRAISEEPSNRSRTSSKIFRNNKFNLGKSMHTES